MLSALEELVKGKLWSDLLEVSAMIASSSASPVVDLYTQLEREAPVSDVMPGYESRSDAVEFGQAVHGRSSCQPSGEVQDHLP